MDRGPYTGPTVTVDVVSLRWDGESLNVATSVRDREPFAGQSALPGCYIYAGDTLEERAASVLAERTGTVAEHLRIVTSGDRTGRDPRGPAVSFVFLETGRTPHAGADMAPPTAFDHADLVESTMAAARNMSGSLLPELLPEKFTLREAWMLTEALTGEARNRNNFDRDFHRLGATQTGEFAATPGRPAALWTYA